MPMFTSATRKRLKLRMAIDGPSGSGKTYTALRFAHALGKKVMAIDTEHRSMSKYQGESPDGISWDWEVCELENFDPQNYTVVIREARKLSPDVLIVDSLSHAWEGIGGALEQVSQSKSANKYTAWKDVTPKHQRMVEAILAFPAHVIVTMRSKMDYILEENEKGKQVPRKIGMAPVQRPGMEYEFDVVCELDWDHVLRVTKTRCPEIDGARVEKPGPAFLLPIIAWLNDAESQPSPPVRTAQDLMGQAMAPHTKPATAIQIEAVKTLAKNTGMSPGDFAQMLNAKHDVQKTADLTADQADLLLVELGARPENPTS